MLLQMALFCFLRLSSIYIVYMHQIFFIHSPLDGHIGCYHVLTTVNSAAMNIGVHVSFKIIFFTLRIFCSDWNKNSFILKL